MLIYEYRCMICDKIDERVAGFDDVIAICHNCGGEMLRITDPFTPIIMEGIPSCNSF